MSDYTMVLKCRHCDLIPGGNAEMGMVVEHYKAEHADQLRLDEDGDVKGLDIDLVPQHKCGTLLKQETPVGVTPSVWCCPKDGKTIVIRERSS